MRIDGLACRRSEQVTLYTVLATWSIRSKKLHLEREKDFPSLDLAMVAMDTRRLVEDRTQLLCVHSGQEWSVKYGSRRGKKRVGMLVPLLRKGRGFAPVIRWRNRRGVDSAITMRALTARVHAHTTEKGWCRGMM